MLPHPELRWIPDAKVRDFLLNGTTPKSSSRLAFLRSHDFDTGSWPVLKDALYRHLDAAKVTLSRRDNYGATYAAFGPLETPSGRLAAVENSGSSAPMTPVRSSRPSSQKARGHSRGKSRNRR